MAEKSIKATSAMTMRGKIGSKCMTLTQGGIWVGYLESILAVINQLYISRACPYLDKKGYRQIAFFLAKIN